MQRSGRLDLRVLPIILRAGTLALAAGAIDDATAWCVLAIVLASFGGGAMIAIQAIVGGLLYGLFTLTLGRKLLRRLGVIAERNGEIGPTLLGVTLMLLMDYRCNRDSFCLRRIYPWCGDATRVLYGGIEEKA